MPLKWIKNYNQNFTHTDGDESHKYPKVETTPCKQRPDYSRKKTSADLSMEKCRFLDSNWPYLGIFG